MLYGNQETIIFNLFYIWYLFGYFKNYTENDLYIIIKTNKNIIQYEKLGSCGGSRADRPRNRTTLPASHVHVHH